MIRVLALLVFVSPALAAPKIDSVTASPAGKAEAEIVIAVTRGGSNCDVRVDFGDGEGRTIDFGMATTRTLKHTYRKGGKFKISAKGAGRTPCDGAKEAPFSVTGASAEKKKSAKKKSAARKKDEKS